ncbi:MAG: hypothetical protein EU536_03660 [Promethearchaeota archaeon]|nr:MAG: hypothetical protein EU536_03660 [Candidatus Lokiarchaeota archaeon]
MIWSFFTILTELVNFRPTGKPIFSLKFGQLDDASPLISKFISLIPELNDYDSGNYQIGKIQFVYSGYDDLLFVVCSDRTDDMILTMQALENAKVAFIQTYFPLIKEGKDDPSLFTSFQTHVENAISITNGVNALPTSDEKLPGEATQATTTTSAPTPKKEIVKIAFIGANGTGKRTILNLLFSGPRSSAASIEESEMIMKKGPISDTYNALLLTMPNEMILSGKTQFLNNTDVVLLVTESVFKDVMSTRKIYEEVRQFLPDAKYGVIANKQDISGAVDPDAIRKVYELPIIPLVATDSANFEMLKTFVIDLIETKSS